MACYNTLEQTPYMPYLILNKLLTSNNENIFKLLKYPTYDALTKDNLTIKEKRDMIWKYGNNQQEYNIFLIPFEEDMNEKTTTILKIWDRIIVPTNHLLADIVFEFDIITHNKIGMVEYNGYPCSRIDVLRTEIIKELNGAEVNGVGTLQFNRGLNSWCKAESGSNMGNNKNYIGTKFLLATMGSSLNG